MKEFSVEADNIFSGLTKLLKADKSAISVSECHNLVPIEKNYDLHEYVIDMHSSGVAWGGGGDFITDVWEDNDSDVWEDHNIDEFIDS